MKVLFLGRAAALARKATALGLRASYDPSDRVDAVVADAVSCRLAPQNVPLIIIGTGTVADWTAKQARPDAIVVASEDGALTELTRLAAEIQQKEEMRREDRDNQSVKNHRGQGVLVLSYANKGGVGKTTVALGLALTLARCGVEVVICDFDFGGPDVASFFGLRPKRGIECLGSVRVGELVVRAGERLYVLPGPVGVDSPQLEGRVLVSALEELRAEFSVVVGDTPPAPWEKAYLHAIFSKADLVYAVVDQSKFSAQETEKYAPVLLAMGVKPERIRIVVNRYSPKLVSLRDVERAFCAGFKKEVRILPEIAAVIPEDWEGAVRAMYRGEVQPGPHWVNMAREVAEIAGVSADFSGYEEGKRKRGLLGWLVRN